MEVTEKYMKMPVGSETIIVKAKAKCENFSVTITRRPNGAIIVDTSENSKPHGLHRTMRPFKTITFSPKKEHEQNKNKNRRIIRFNRAPLSFNPLIPLNGEVMPDIHCQHTNVMWQNDTESDTRSLLCADCGKVLKIDNTACKHTKFKVVKQTESPHTQKRCVQCRYTWWDFNLSNSLYIDPYEDIPF